MRVQEVGTSDQARITSDTAPTDLAVLPAVTGGHDHKAVGEGDHKHPEKMLIKIVKKVKAIVLEKWMWKGHPRKSDWIMDKLV